MKIKEITAVIESFAPLAAQEAYDNSGLLAGDPEGEVQQALLCVDITESVLQEALDTHCGLIIAHHPVIFHPLRRLTGETYIQRVVARAIREGVALYACHTNLDSVPGGMSWRLAEMLGLHDVRLLDGGRPDDPSTGFGVVGKLPAPVETNQFLKTIQKILDAKAIRHSKPFRQKIQTVALCTGSGASLIHAAVTAGADIYLSADFKYNDFLDAENRILAVDAGHFETEYHAIHLLHDIITKKIPTFALRKSRNAMNPVHYFV